MIPASLLPIGSEWMVAGGWAVCPALASDMDVFVLKDNRDSEADVRMILLAHLRHGKFDFEELTDERSEDSPGECDSLIRKVAKVNYNGNTVHVLLGLSPFPEDILNTFDLSICQVGIMWDGTIVKGENYTSPAQPLKIVKQTPTTDERARKYNERFKLRKGHIG